MFGIAIANNPSITTQGNYSIDKVSGRPLYSKNKDTAYELGSVTKLMTAILLCRTVANLNTTFTAATADLDQPSGSPFQVPLQNGDVLTASDCMYGMFLPSANDAALCIGRSVGNIINGGGLTTFVNLMNSYASTLQCTNTTFLAPHGGDSTGSPHDLVNIMDEALNYSAIVTTMGTLNKTISISGGRTTTVDLTNINPLFSDTGIIVGKTGNPAGQSYRNLVEVWDTVGGKRTINATFASTNDTTRVSDMRAIITRIPLDWTWSGNTPVRQ